MQAKSQVSTSNTPSPQRLFKPFKQVHLIFPSDFNESNDLITPSDSVRGLRPYQLRAAENQLISQGDYIEGSNLITPSDSVCGFIRTDKFARRSHPLSID
ncbi:hypothetical protein J6590_023534 [Homalodisca vitripennis]|nr:hypothetical protein J6590_023534 [Homalodisca vitripennis]